MEASQSSWMKTFFLRSLIQRDNASTSSRPNIAHEDLWESWIFEEADLKAVMSLSEVEEHFLEVCAEWKRTLKERDRNAQRAFYNFSYFVDLKITPPLSSGHWVEVVYGMCNCLRTDDWRGSQTVVARFNFVVKRHGTKSTVLKQVAETKEQVPPEEFFRRNPCEVPRRKRVREVRMDEQNRKKVVKDMLENEGASVKLKEV